MTLLPALSLSTLVALGGCAALVHHPSDSFAHTQALAEADEPDAQLDLARMYADPAAWPQMAGRQADPVLAAEWCTIVSWGLSPTQATLARGPSCRQILATLSPEAVATGGYLANEQRAQSMSRGD